MALSSNLLNVIGQRVAENVFAHQDPAVTARILSSLTTTVSSWIRKQVFPATENWYIVFGNRYFSKKTSDLYPGNRIQLENQYSEYKNMYFR